MSRSGGGEFPHNGHFSHAQGGEGEPEEGLHPYTSVGYGAFLHLGLEDEISEISSSSSEEERLPSPRRLGGVPSPERETQPNQSHNRDTTPGRRQLPTQDELLLRHSLNLEEALPQLSLFTSAARAVHHHKSPSPPQPSAPSRSSPHRASRPKTFLTAGGLSPKMNEQLTVEAAELLDATPSVIRDDCSTMGGSSKKRDILRKMAKGWMSLIWKWDRAFTKWNGYSPSRDQMRIHIPLWLLAYKSVQDCLQVMDPGGQMWRREQQEKEAMERAQREMLERQERLRRQQEEEEEEERRAAQFLGPF